MSRAGFQPRREPKTSDLLIRQKVEAMIEYGHCALRQFPKSERHVLSAEIRSSMWALLRLRTNAKTQVFPVSAGRGRGLDFLGYHMWPAHRRLRRSSIRRIVRTLKKARRLYAAGEIELDQVRASVQSWVAHASGADAYGLRARLLSSFAFQRSVA